jgi:hypothetical protein
MRGVAVLVVFAGCYSQDESPPPARPAPKHASASAGDVPELTCSHPAPPALRGVDPQQGGFRLLETDAEVEAVRNAMQSGTGAPSSASSRRPPALWAAFDELRASIQYCMVEADGNHPALEYELRFSITGNSIASLIEHVHLLRITDTNVLLSSPLVTSQAEACVAQLLTHVELPPGDSIDSTVTSFRQDFCTRTIDVARRTTHRLVDAYMAWWRSHRGQTCPASLAELQELEATEALDPWHQPYVMRCDSSGFQVLSAGPDRTFGTDDDVEAHR